MLKNRWAFNALSMGTPHEFDEHTQHDIILVGDSIVGGATRIALDEE